MKNKNKLVDLFLIMVENIKSLFILKLIFLHLEPERKLYLIRYNQKLKKIMNINIRHYKILSGKYIKYETKNEGKEYNAYNDLLLFEGEYFKGKKNGKGKEYDFEGNLIFEGNYKNGEKYGKGKEYNKNELIFEGNYKNGEKHGKGKEYQENKLIFEGDYKKGKINGMGKEYNTCGNLIFEGEYKENENKGKDIFKENNLTMNEVFNNFNCKNNSILGVQYKYYLRN